MDETINLRDWYTASEALARLEANAGRKLDESTPRQLIRNKDKPAVRFRKIGNQTLYWKADIDAYQVEERGQKVARAQRVKGLANKQAKKRRATPKKPEPGASFAIAI